MLNGEAGEPGNIMYTEFPHDVRPVSVGSLGAHAQAVGDFFGGAPFGNQLQHFAFAGSEFVGGITLVGEKHDFAERSHDLAAHIRFTGSNFTDALFEFVDRGVFVDNALNPGFENRLNTIARRVSGKNNDFGFG